LYSLSGNGIRSFNLVVLSVLYFCTRYSGPNETEILLF
jgi:hypothetical protein